MQAFYSASASPSFSSKIMKGNGFVNELLDNTNHFYSASLKMFDWWRKIIGVKCQVVRLSDDYVYRKVYGSIATSTLVDDENANRFNYTALFGTNDMLRLYSKSTDPIQMYDNRDILKAGDLLIFSRGDQEFKWKVTDLFTFSEAGGVLNQYTISGLTEVDSTRNLEF